MGGLPLTHTANAEIAPYGAATRTALQICLCSLLLFATNVVIPMGGNTEWQMALIFSDKFAYEQTRRSTAAATTTATDNQTKAFSNLELFVSCFPGDPDDENVNGFTELQSTLIRSLQFFWPRPRDNLRITVALDDTVYSTSEERNDITQHVKSFFDRDLVDRDRVSVVYNPLSDKVKYGRGYLIQQLIMFWADNFTNSEYIGFVDDDTLFSRSIQPNDLFDTMGRPRVIPLPADSNQRWTDGTRYSFQREPKVYGMTYFPVVIKRSLLRDMREFILRIHPQYSHFDEFYTALIRRHGEDLYDRENEFSQFYMMMDYAFHNHQDEYHWHIETSEPELDGFNVTHVEPFPRVSLHAGWMDLENLEKHKNKKARREIVSNTLREGYCYSLPRWNQTALDEKRCASYNIDESLYWRGEWTFEYVATPWRWNQAFRDKMALAHAEKMKRNELRRWDDRELKEIFGE